MTKLTGRNRWMSLQVTILLWYFVCYQTNMQMNESCQLFTPAAKHTSDRYLEGLVLHIQSAVLGSFLKMKLLQDSALWPEQPVQEIVFKNCLCVMCGNVRESTLKSH